MSPRVPLILGTCNMGVAGRTAVSVSTTDAAQELVDVFSEKYTELDSARIYGDGTAEELLSKLDLRGDSIDTKVHPKNHPGGHQPEAIRSVVETCLEALHPHKIRVLYLHRPDRSVPFETTLREINKLHQEGKFELFGLSNYPAWELVEMIHICKANNWIEPTYCQAPYNAISRTIESELIPAARKYGIRVVTYNPLAAGFLTGRISSREDVGGMDDIFNAANSWLGPVLQARYLNDSQLEAMKVVKAAAEKADIPLAEIGYRWLQHHSALCPTDGIIFGSSTLAHLRSNMASVEKGPLPEGVVSALDAAYKIVGHDAPQYWR
ncbi:Aldo/keto reductase [Russula vinacea]|nr:Aldo/keto reductase [Russula vinacea]KAH9993748.1 Aldo/keto reductase [Russula vinacea]